MRGGGMSQMSPRALVLIVFGAAGLLGCQTTGGQIVSPVAVAGKPLRLGHFANLNPDCSPIGEPDVRVSKLPDHGVVTVRAGEGYTNFAPANPRNHCNYRPTPGVNATYTASAATSVRTPWPWTSFSRPVKNGSSP